MAEQRARNVRAVIKEEEDFGVELADVTGAQRIRTTASPGLKQSRGQVRSEERRDDGWRAPGRLGQKTVGGGLNGEISLGGFWNTLLSAAVRADWVAEYLITEADVTSITTTTDKIIASAGSFLTENVRVGDVLRLANHATAANNDKNLQVLAISANGRELTFPAGSLTANAVADTDFDITVLRKLSSGTEPVSKSFQIEQYLRDLDGGELFLGCRLSQLRITGGPDQMARYESTWVGKERVIIAEGTGPFFTDPTVTTGKALVFDDSVLRLNGVAVSTITAFDLTFNVDTSGIGVVASQTTPGVYDDDAAITGTISIVRDSLDSLTDWDNETEFEMFLLFEEPGVAPKNTMGMFFGNVMILDVDAQFMGASGSGPQVETRQIEIRPKVAADGYDASPVTILTNAT